MIGRRTVLTIAGSLGLAGIVPGAATAERERDADPHEYLRENILDHRGIRHSRIETREVRDSELWVTYENTVNPLEKNLALRDPNVHIGGINADEGRKIEVQYIYRE